MMTNTFKLLFPNSVQREEETSRILQEEPVILKLGETVIHSLKELRDNFQAEALIKVYTDGDLLKWLIQHYYEKEADLVSQMELTDPNCLKQLCSALGISCDKLLTEDEKKELEKKKERIRQYTDDEDIISHPEAVAFNQEDLARLLNQKVTKIYLCQGEFSLPIRVANVEYVGFGNATISNSYTKEQYEKAGITITGFTLADKINPDTEDIAKEAAKANGYDDFSENHSPLTTLFHNMLKCGKPEHYHHLSFNSFGGKFFNSKSECRNTREREIKKVYCDAQKYLSTDDSKSVSRECTAYYSKFIEGVFRPHLETLQKIAFVNNAEDAFQKLNTMVSQCRKNLKTLFESELLDNSDYYRMYDLNYFIDQVDISEHDYHVNEHGLARLIESAFSVDSVQYTIDNLYDSVSEMENDLNEYVATFYSAAHSEYKDYVSELEELLENIGKNLPDVFPGEDIVDYLKRCCVKPAV